MKLSELNFELLHFNRGSGLGVAIPYSFVVCFLDCKLSSLSAVVLYSDHEPSMKGVCGF